MIYISQHLAGIAQYRQLWLKFTVTFVLFNFAPAFEYTTSLCTDHKVCFKDETSSWMKTYLIDRFQHIIIADGKCLASQIDVFQVHKTYLKSDPRA